MYCHNCKADTRHFATISLGLPCCSKCFGLNSEMIFGAGVGLLEPLKQDDDILLKNAVIESEVIKRKRKRRER